MILRPDQLITTTYFDEIAVEISILLVVEGC
jgi:hypothetical protein